MSLVWEKLIRPLLFRLDAETAHEIGIKALSKGMAKPFAKVHEFPALRTEQFGLTFSNPLGIAAGFDKNAIAVNELASLGFGFVEVGTVTFDPQPGNDKPRLFRLPEDNALINRLGFNNQGAENVAHRLAAIRRRCVVGVNIGKNKSVPNEEAVENYLQSFSLVHSLADYIAINISSPNTPNLRELQRSENLDDLLRAVMNRNQELGAKPILVKIAPDLSEGEIESVVDICMRYGVAGVIATNTTVSREMLKTSDAFGFGAGGLSGRPLTKRSNEVISAIYRHSKAKLPIVGVGGIFTGQDAFDKIVAGASLLQAYTGFIYGGPSFAGDVNSWLAEELDRKGFKTIDDAVGSFIKG